MFHYPLLKKSCSRVIFRYALLLILFPFFNAYSKEFDFFNFTGPITAKSYSVISTSGLPVGRLLITKINSQELQFQFEVLLKNLKGSVSLKHSIIKNKQYINLNYYVNHDNKIEQGAEVLPVDSYLTDRGILVFYYNKRTRFFQMGKNSNGRYVFVTDWGGAAIKDL